MACSMPGILGLNGQPPTAIKIFLAVSSEVLPVDVSCTEMEFGPVREPVASITSTPAFLSTKF